MKKKGFKTVATTAFSLTILIGLLFPLTKTANAAGPPVSITSCTTISNPGEYRLDADLFAFFETCIRINASQVDLDLNGHTIDGLFIFDESTAGIQVVGVTRVDINGPGVITNFGRGVDFEGVDHSEVKDVTLTLNFQGFVVNRDFITPNLNKLSEKNWFRGNTSTGNFQHGFTLNGASNNYFLNNVSSNNGAQGFLVADGSANQFKSNTANGNVETGINAAGGGEHTVKDNTANGNGIVGIVVPVGSTKNSVKGNTAQSNVSVDLRDDNTNCDQNHWTNNIFNTASQPCIH
jgi:parallel beta-helix repeat protein